MKLPLTEKGKTVEEENQEVDYTVWKAYLYIKVQKQSKKQLDLKLKFLEAVTWLYTISMEQKEGKMFLKI